MVNDGILNIAVGLSAKTKIWKNEKITWSALVNKLSTENKTLETYAQYISASKEDQTKIKDVGGFVGGYLRNGKRHPQNVVYRQLITLDLDEAYGELWSDFTMIYSCAAVLHGTHKYTPSNPRFRLIIPISREVTPEEYEAISRKIAGNIGIKYFDNTTFEVNRLMFWPSNPVDIEYYVRVQDGEWLDADEVLSQYENWHNTDEWPRNLAHSDEIRLQIDKQEDPSEKKGIVGLFCRTYTITEAIEHFLQDIYAYYAENRYTYAKGSTAGGLIIYDDKFAYSHHGTDPCCNRTSNAFDLVRIHKFGYLDSGTERMEKEKKSYKKMEELALSDKNVKRVIAHEKLANKDIKVELTEDDKWIEELKLDTRGNYISNSINIDLILQNDPNIKDSFRYNKFDNRRYIIKSVPWRIVHSEEPLRDVDYSGLRNYIETVYDVSSSNKIEDSLALELERNSYHPIIDFLESIKWDGIERVDTLLIDYFGAADTIYSREAIRKSLCAAVARVYNPGIKYDLVLTLVGAQGTGKSTFLKKLGGDWFSDTFTTVQGKEAFEQIQGAWIIEIAELSGLKKAEVETIKQFISKGEDMYRPAYGRTVETYKRQCVFFGTTNTYEFLRDPSGNRRFIPVDINIESATLNVWDHLTKDEVKQIWAEAVLMFKAGELLYMGAHAEKAARIEQMRHSEIDERKGLIEDYLNRKLPENWYEQDIMDRRRILDDPLSAQEKDRLHVCIAEIWCECLGKQKEEMSRYNTRDINDIMKTMQDWEYINSTRNFTIYGKQKYYVRRIN